jgi:hypothetical protein
MEGNFRIVQEADNEFIIQKEYETFEEEISWSMWFIVWKTKVPVTKWIIVDVKGEFTYWTDSKHHCYKTLDEAKKALEDIKKYPKVVYDRYSGLLDIISK